LSFASGAEAGVVHLGAVGAALAYNAGLKSTVASVVPYAFAFGALPAFVTLGLPGSPAPPVWSVAAGALMGVGAHFVNTLADRVDDERTGVRGLPQRLSPTASLFVGVVALSAASSITALAPPGSPSAIGVGFAGAALVAAAAVMAAVLTGRHRFAWSLTISVAALTVGGFIAGGNTLGP
jgi:4-hydroxybenzoate polyprenyltransferase